jgi:hypothetical protein
VHAIAQQLQHFERRKPGAFAETLHQLANRVVSIDQWRALPWLITAMSIREG